MKFITPLAILFVAYLLSVNGAPRPQGDPDEPDVNGYPISDPRLRAFAGGIPEIGLRFRRQIGQLTVPVRHPLTGLCSSTTCSGVHKPQCCEGYAATKCVYSENYCPIGFMAVNFDDNGVRIHHIVPGIVRPVYPVVPRGPHYPGVYGQQWQDYRWQLTDYRINTLDSKVKELENKFESS